jgi:threonine synthase
MNFLTHLECAFCGQELEADHLWNLCPKCEKPLLARYDLEKASRTLSREAIAERGANLWRYRELLPVRDPRHALCLGEGFTPLVHATRLGQAVGFDNLFIKDEGLNPTGSFKARGLAMAISRAHELGVEAVSIPSAGNAAGAMSAYAALAGMQAYAFMPRDVPQLFVAECRALGAEVALVDGLITDCGRIAAEGVRQFGRFDVSTLKEPYRLEGKKTMGYELAEQMGWTLPDVIIYPTGGGTGLIGMWKAFQELRQLGWLQSDTLPRMIAVQSDGCAPIVRAFEAGERFAEEWKAPSTTAWGLRVPAAVGDFMILDAVRASGGLAVAVPEKAILPAMQRATTLEGVAICPETAACVVAAEQLVRDGRLQRDQRTVLFNTASALKYQDGAGPELPLLPADAAIDYSRL